MGRKVAVVIAIVFSVLGLSAAGYSSYTGSGLPATGPQSARQGSIFGPWVMGGGPNSGK